MEPAKYVHGGEGTLVEDDVVGAVADIADDAERKGVLTWYARVACVSVSGGVVVIASIPGTAQHCTNTTASFGVVSGT